MECKCILLQVESSTLIRVIRAIMFLSLIIIIILMVTSSIPFLSRNDIYILIGGDINITPSPLTNSISILRLVFCSRKVFRNEKQNNNKEEWGKKVSYSLDKWTEWLFSLRVNCVCICFVIITIKSRNTAFRMCNDIKPSCLSPQSRNKSLLLWMA